MAELQPFEDSSDLLGDSQAIRDRAERDGYFYVRGLLPTERVLGVRRDIVTILDRHGWLQAGTDSMDGIADMSALTNEGEPAFMAVYDEVQRLESFHRLALEPALIDFLGDLFDDTVLAHPRNIARLMFPQNNTNKTPPHQDFIHIQGTENTWTCWAPLGDCPRELGGLEILAGSHHAGLLPGRVAPGAGGVGVDTDGVAGTWRAGDLQAGDVLLFQSLTVHQGTSNTTADRMRLSVDYRYQPLSEPVVEGSLLPHHGRLTWDDIYADWSDDAPRYYWRELDVTLGEFTSRYHEAAGRAG